VRGFSRANRFLQPMSFQAESGDLLLVARRIQISVCFGYFLSYSDHVLRFAPILVLALAAAAQTSPPADGVRIKLERKGSGMDLSMPVYSVAIEGDGTVLYEGRTAVHAVGIRKRRIPPSAVHQLAQTLADKGYFDLPTSYGVCEDGSTVETSLEMSGRVKKISDSCGAGSAALRQMETEIDRVSGSSKWVRSGFHTFMHWPWFHSKG